jgi:hypothetical protein
MGELRSLATGNIPLRELKEEIQQKMGISDERLTDI